MTPAVRAGLLAPTIPGGTAWPSTASSTTFPCARGIPATPRWTKIEAGLAQFRHHPVCLIWGMQDWCFTPAFLERFLEFFPAAEVHRLADAGHYVVEDAHERIVPLVSDFLVRHPLRGNGREPRGQTFLLPVTDRQECLSSWYNPPGNWH